MSSSQDLTQTAKDPFGCWVSRSGCLDPHYQDDGGRSPEMLSVLGSQSHMLSHEIAVGCGRMRRVKADLRF